MAAMRPPGLRLLALCLTLVLAACGLTTWTPTLYPGTEPPSDDGRGAYLKVHMHSGELYVLDRWTTPTAGGALEGAGTRFDVSRARVASGAFTIDPAEVALFETNRRETVSRFALSGLSVLTGLYGITTIACLADPKSCFGSCPTFYTVDDPDRPIAEGFSASFARALEAEDLDDLGLVAGPGPFSLVMRNEALETHAVRSLALRAVPVSGTGVTLQSVHGSLLAASQPRAPRACRSQDGDCLSAVTSRDDREFAPLTDAEDLAVREEVLLDFGPATGDLGLVLTARNSLVTTYVFYQSLAYAGTRAAELLAALERGEPGAADRALGIARELGGIEAYVEDAPGVWRSVGEFSEAGPIAADRQVIPLGRVASDELRVKLVMARGSWRVDEATLSELASPVEPITVPVDSVTTAGGANPLALERLRDSERHLVTAPGDEYRLWFTLPPGDEYRVFLDSEGYYYEWLREPWLAEESVAETSTVLLQPGEALRRMAPGFKQVEPEMERLFWESRFRR